MTIDKSPFFSFLNQVSQNDPAARSRSLALKCLLKIRYFPYIKIHPMKMTVVKGLSKVIDDKKRAIRLLGAKVRNEWMIIGINE